MIIGPKSFSRFVYFCRSAPGLPTAARTGAHRVCRPSARLSESSLYAPCTQRVSRADPGGPRPSAFVPSTYPSVSQSAAINVRCACVLRDPRESISSNFVGRPLPVPRLPSPVRLHRRTQNTRPASASPCRRRHLLSYTIDHDHRIAGASPFERVVQDHVANPLPAGAPPRTSFNRELWRGDDRVGASAPVMDPPFRAAGRPRPVAVTDVRIMPERSARARRRACSDVSATGRTGRDHSRIVALYTRNQ